MNSLKIFNLLDNIFSHDEYSVAGQKSDNIIWNRNVSNYDIPTFYSHQYILNNPINFENAYGLIFESRSIIPHIYKEIEQHIPKFKLVFTHNSEFLKKYSNCRWINGGGIWIGGKIGLGEIKITPKSKLCSLVSSNKTMCHLHNYRLQIAHNLSANQKVDVFTNTWIPIYNSLENYMFSIVVENFQDELYFTEKILNCFATGTIPIYLGCSNLKEKFNIEGIIQFNTIDELNSIIDMITPEFYYNKINVIKENFELCKQYRTIEDYIYRNYFI